MPNGGRLGDNHVSWFMDDLCAGNIKYLGEPIDSLACEVYRLTGNEFAAGIDPEDKIDEIDKDKLEADLRRKLKELKKNRRLNYIIAVIIALLLTAGVIALVG